MNGALLLLIAVACFLGGYFLYARKIERILGIDPSRPTPAHTKKDGIDFIPAHPTVLFGHHFAAIAGAGPIVGPVLAAEFGWASVALWIILGCIFIGAAHDMIALFLSIRHGGESIGTVIGTILGKPGKILFLLFSWSALILVLAEFTRTIAGTFVADPAIATASLLFIAEAVVFGLCVNKFKLSVLWMSLIFVPLMFGFVWIGNLYPLDLCALFGFAPETTRMVWIVVLLIYCFFASTCPVWILLQPRDYLNAYLLYAMMALGFIGVFVAHPTLNIDAFAGFAAVGKAGVTDYLFPFLFVTVACGACSGFHALVASGTSAKQLDSEKGVRPIAYGGMLLEGVLAIIALIGVAGAYASQADYVTAIQSNEAVTLFAGSIAGFCVKFFASIGIPESTGTLIAKSFILLSVSAFLMTTVDAGTRLARFSWQELVGNRKVASNMYVGTLIVVLLAAGLLLGASQTSKQLWTIFASANQLLAALTLLAATLWFMKNRKPAWLTGVPMVLMMIVSSIALGTLLYKSFAAETIDWVKGGATGFLLTLAVVLVVFAVRQAKALVIVVSVGACLASGCSSDQVVERDVVIYGSSPAALTAAIEAQALGKTAVIVSPETRIGGLTTGGLGQTDIGNKTAFGGLALQFYKDVAAYYKDDANWTYEKRTDYLPDGQCAGTKGADSMWTFEPSAALKILEGWEKKHALEIRRGEWLDRGKKVEVEGRGGQRRIVSFVAESGRVYKGKMFVDATYEGDLMAAAGVSYTVGREANAVYGETISGIETKLATNHQLEKGIDPYVVKGDPSSGLLPGIEPYDPSEKDGDGDTRVQAYCFRMCLTDDPSNRIPFVKPAGYDPLNYELLLRNLEAIPQERFAAHIKDYWAYMPWINSRMPNRKTDTNNRTGVSTDFIGGNWAWPEASYAERKVILKAHLDWQMGLMWTLANDPRVPEPIRTEVAKWGTCRDEFADGLGNGWQSQLYVREARRLVGDTVMTEHHCRGAQRVTRPVAMGAYGMDSHNVRRYVGADGFAHNEGNIEDYKGLDGNRFPPYGIDYGAIVPKKAECTNLFVPVCLSASHMAFGSIRMEPVFFALGQSAGAAAALSIDAGCAVQDLPYETLQARLVTDGQVIGL